MEILIENGVEYLRHSTPLHYLPYIVGDQSLKSKATLSDDGFIHTHFRSTSHRTDVSRGFMEYVHLTLNESPRILEAKLNAGFPHVELLIPIRAIDPLKPYILCRYNVAKTRRLPTSPTGGFTETDCDGRYHDGFLVPVAKTNTEKQSMIEKYFGTNKMIEVLVPHILELPNTTELKCFAERDFNLARQIVAEYNSDFSISIADHPYEPNDLLFSQVQNFIQTVREYPNWKGSGLEFDRF